MEQKQWIAKVLCVLTFVVVITLIASVLMNFGPLFAWSWAPKSPFEHLTVLILCTAALIGILTYMQARDRADSENKRSRSKFFFRQASHGLDEAYALLCDQNNNRVIWVRAARSLLQAKKLAKEIELEEYQRAYRLYENRVRNDLYLALTIPGENPGQRQPLPPHFFFGLPDWKADADAEKLLDEVAIKASNRMEAYTVTIDRVPPEPTLYPLAERSVMAIFDFLDYPEDYEDPLDEVENWSTNWEMVRGEKSGAARYVSHRQTKYVAGGEIHERTPPEGEE